MRSLFLLGISFIILAIRPAQASPDDKPVIAPTWISRALGKPLVLTLTEPANFSHEHPTSVVIYLKNLAAPRLGTESDETIIKDFLASGYLVVELDFAHAPQARVPKINLDAGKLRDDIRSRQLLQQYNVDNAHVYLVPAGHRILRDVIYYKDGGRALGFDLIYPSKPAQPVGTVLEFSCDNKDRMGNTSLSICSDTLLDGEATEGYAVALADHPVAAPYKGIDPMPDCARKIKAAARTLRATAHKLGLSEKIVPVGFSRGSGMALMLVTTASRPEFEGYGETLGIDSAVQGAVVLSGRFSYLDLLPNDPMIPRYNAAWGERDKNLATWREHGALDYLIAPTRPLFLSINCSESPDALHQMEVLRKRLAVLGNDETFTMERVPRGHKVPLAPEILDAINRYLTQQLQPTASVSPK